MRAGIGITALTSYDIWQDSPEKVLGCLESWQQQNPATLLALCGALKQACNWLETVPNRFEAARLLCQTQYLDADIDVIAPSLLGSCLTHKDMAPRYIPSYNQFSSSDNGSINLPQLVRGEWLLKQMQRSGQLEQVNVPGDFIGKVFRPDIYLQMRTLLEQREKENLIERASEQ